MPIESYWTWFQLLNQNSTSFVSPSAVHRHFEIAKWWWFVNYQKKTNKKNKTKKSSATFLFTLKKPEFTLPGGSHQIKLPPSRLTCVGHHQPASSMTKHRRCFVQRPAQRLKDPRSEKVFASPAQRCPYCNPSVVRSQAPRKCLRVGHDVVLCPFRRPCENNERFEICFL